MQLQSEVSLQRLVLRKVLQPNHFQSNRQGCCKNTAISNHGAFICGWVTKVFVHLFVQQNYCEMFYKYGTIYREVLHTPRKIDWCFYMNNLDTARKDLLFKQLIDILDNVSPGFVRPCPWKVTSFFFNFRTMNAMKLFERTLI